MARQAGVLMTHDEWRAIVGSKIAARTRPGKLQRGVLTVKVASSAWSNELSFLRPQILDRLSKAGHEVQRLRFVVDQELSTRPAARAKAQAHGPRPTDFRLPEELLERLRQIDDPNLRAAVAEAARASLSRAGKPDETRKDD